MTTDGQIHYCSFLNVLFQLEFKRQDCTFHTFADHLKYYTKLLYHYYTIIIQLYEYMIIIQLLYEKLKHVGEAKRICCWLGV